MNGHIKWIGQGGYILTDGNTEICIDPYLSDIVEKVAGKARIVECPVKPAELNSDIVICTHDHLDHLDPDAISEMDKSRKLFLGPASCIKHLRKLGADNTEELNAGHTKAFGSFKLTGVYADHLGDSIGLVIECDGIVLYLTSDTLYHEKLKEVKKYKPDIMIVCINGKLGNMNVQEAVRLTREIKPKVGIPSHYGMFESNTGNPQIYIDGLKGPGIKGFEMEFNKEYSLTEVMNSV